MSTFENIAIISKISDNSVKDSLDAVIEFLDKKNISYYGIKKKKLTKYYSTKKTHKFHRHCCACGCS